MWGVGKRGGEEREQGNEIETVGDKNHKQVCDDD